MSASSPPQQRRRATSLDLPHWIYDVDEVDTFPSHMSLLQELEIDGSVIINCTRWMLLFPWLHIASKFSGSSIMMRHPLLDTKAQYEFWGPCLIVSLYVIVLWLARLQDVPWIYVIWCGATIFAHLSGRVFLKQNSLYFHLSVLGYSIAPLILIAATVVIFQPARVLRVVVELLGIAWCSSSAYVSYTRVCNPTSEAVRPRFYLMLMPILLMHVYLISLIPRKKH